MPSLTYPKGVKSNDNNGNINNDDDLKEIATTLE